MADLLQPLPVRGLADRLAALRSSPRLRPVLAAGGAVMAVAVLLAVGAAFLRSSSPPPRLTLPKADPGSAAAAPEAAPAGGPDTPGTQAPGTQAPGTTTPVTVTVHVAGQVVHPGVYAVPAGARVADAIVAAGGASPEADAEQLNLAARVADAERIYVPKQGEAVSTAGPVPVPASSGPGTASTAAARPLDLNTATAEQLEALPGIGPATSKAILTYRGSHGRFRSVTELLDVPGIGPAKLEALRPLVRV